MSAIRRSGWICRHDFAGLASRRGRGHSRAGVFENHAQHFARVGIVVDDQHARAGEPRLLCLGRCRRIGFRAARGSRQPHGECRALADAGALGVHRAAVHADQIVDDRQTQPEAAVRARRAAVALTEALEHVRQKAGIDAASGIGDDDLEEPGIGGADA